MAFFFFFLVSVATGGPGSAFGGSVVTSYSCWAGGTTDGLGYAEVVAAAATGLVTKGSEGSFGLILFSIIRAKYIKSSMP